MIVNDSTKAIAQKVDDYFLVHPERHDQNNWAALEDDEYRAVEIDDENVCNTTMCVAGSAVFVSRPIHEFRAFAGGSNSWEDEGAVLLGLDGDEAEWLFYDTSNEIAIDAVRAIANGDEDKFKAIRKQHPYSG